jgi:hypothetical protein
LGVKGFVADLREPDPAGVGEERGFELWPSDRLVKAALAKNRQTILYFIIAKSPLKPEGYLIRARFGPQGCPKGNLKKLLLNLRDKHGLAGRQAVWYPFHEQYSMNDRDGHRAHKK